MPLVEHAARWNLSYDSAYLVCQRAGFHKWAPDHLKVVPERFPGEAHDMRTYCEKFWSETPCTSCSGLQDVSHSFKSVHATR